MSPIVARARHGPSCAIFGIVVAAYAVGGVALTPPAHGDLIEYRFFGDVDNLVGIPTGDWADVTLGSPFTLTVVVDVDAPDLDDGWGAGWYVFDALSVTIGDVTAPMTDIGINDRVEIDLYEPFFALHSFEVVFGDGTMGGVLNMVGHDIWESDALPTTLDYDAFDVWTTMGFGTIDFNVDVWIDSLSVTVIPAPPGAALLALGLIPRARRRRAVRASDTSRRFR